MSDNTLNKALRIWVTILALAATTARTASARPRRPFSTKRALRRRSSGSPTRPRRGEKRRRRRDEVVRCQLGKGDKNKIRGIYNRPAPIGQSLDSLRDGASAVSLRIGGLACSRFDPRQRSVKFIHAVEVDHRLAPHLVGPDPLVGDQLISFSLSEFAIAATVLELDEPAPLVVIIVNHGYCMCFDDLRHNRIKPR